MSIPQPLISFLRYYKRVIKRILKDCWKFGREQVFIAILASLLILLLQMYYRVIPKELTTVSFLSVAYPYLGIIVAAFVFHAVRAPYLLDRDRQTAIDALETDKSRQDKLIERQDDQDAKTARRKWLRERLGELFAEGDRIRWGSVSQRAGWNSEHSQWLKKVKEFLTQEPEFDGSHIARFDAEQLVAIKEFIKEHKD